MDPELLKIAFVFLETTSIETQRFFFENIMGMHVVENQFNPPHHQHGIVKYDAGNIILALNLTVRRKLDSNGREGLIMVASSGHCRKIQKKLLGNGYFWDERDNIVLDKENHVYKLEQRPDAPSQQLCIHKLQLVIKNLNKSVHFYHHLLGLDLKELSGDRAVLQTGNIQLDLLQAQPPDRPAPDRYNGYLIVFHVRDIQDSYRVLSLRGMAFNSRPGYSDIGGTVRFEDDDGHTFCLYEPARECFDWGSGPTLQRIIEHSEHEKSIP